MPIRHIFTVTPRIAEELASIFTLDLDTMAIGTADPGISIIGMTAGIVIGKSPWLTASDGDFAMTIGSDAQKGLREN